jgi:methylmalonyl-CoA mutase N-terminal domain/subunit
MRMFAGFGTPEQTNERFKYLLAQGQTGLSTAFDFPTLMGYDSDSPLSLGEVGMCGVAVDTLRDMEILFDGIPLDKVTTSMTINGPGHRAAGLLRGARRHPRHSRARPSAARSRTTA